MMQKIAGNREKCARRGRTMEVSRGRGIEGGLGEIEGAEVTGPRHPFDIRIGDY